MVIETSLVETGTTGASYAQHNSALRDLFLSKIDYYNIKTCTTCPPLEKQTPRSEAKVFAHFSDLLVSLTSVDDPVAAFQQVNESEKLSKMYQLARSRMTASELSQGTDTGTTAEHYDAERRAVYAVLERGLHWHSPPVQEWREQLGRSVDGLMRHYPIDRLGKGYSVPRSVHHQTSYPTAQLGPSSLGEVDDFGSGQEGESFQIGDTWVDPKTLEFYSSTQVRFLDPQISQRLRSLSENLHLLADDDSGQECSGPEGPRLPRSPRYSPSPIFDPGEETGTGKMTPVEAQNASDNLGEIAIAIGMRMRSGRDSALSSRLGEISTSDSEGRASSSDPGSPTDSKPKLALSSESTVHYIPARLEATVLEDTDPLAGSLPVTRRDEMTMGIIAEIKVALTCQIEDPEVKDRLSDAFEYFTGTAPGEECDEFTLAKRRIDRVADHVRDRIYEDLDTVISAEPDHFAEEMAKTLGCSGD